MNRSLRVFCSVVGAQVLFLVGWAGYHEIVRRNAPVVLLEARPADPRDPLRGDYMVLQYPINAIGISQDLTIGTDVWVLLRSDGTHYYAADYSTEPIASTAQGEFVVRGTVSAGRGDGSRRVTYGIENVFVPEGAGRPDFTVMEIEASVGWGGRLQFRRMLLDGTPYP